MQIFLDEVAARHLNDRIVMVLDGAGWHKSKSLLIPHNRRLLTLPPYSPELNPVEHIWDICGKRNFSTEFSNDMYICEIPLEGKLNPDRHMYEEMVCIASGRGAIRVWGDTVGGVKRILYLDVIPVTKTSKKAGTRLTKSIRSRGSTKCF